MYLIAFLIFSASLGVHAFENNLFHIEAGIVENSYNKVRIPGDTGDKFNLADSFNESQTYFRLDFKHRLNESNHGIRLLYAPLKFSGEQSFEQNVDFDGETFTSGEPTDTEFQFNSYRISYFYQILKEDGWTALLGGSAKVRDAKIALRQDGLKKERSDLGLVPLVYFWGRKTFQNNYMFTFDFDGLVAPQGRAIDAAFSAGYNFSKMSAINLGFRMLEGGADNDRVYTFSQFNYLFASYELAF